MGMDHNTAKQLPGRTRWFLAPRPSVVPSGLCARQPRSRQVAPQLRVSLCLGFRPLILFMALNVRAVNVCAVAEACCFLDSGFLFSESGVQGGVPPCF